MTHNAPSISGLPVDIGPLGGNNRDNDLGGRGQARSAVDETAGAMTAKEALAGPVVEVRGEVYMRQQDLVKVMDD